MSADAVGHASRVSNYSALEIATDGSNDSRWNCCIRPLSGSMLPLSLIRMLFDPARCGLYLATCERRSTWPA